MLRPFACMTAILSVLPGAWAAAPSIRLQEGMIVTSVVSYLTHSPDLVQLLKHLGADGLQWETESQISTTDEQRNSSGYAKGAFTRTEDLQTSHRLFLRVFADESEARVGATTGMASSEVFAELRNKGETAIDVIEIPPEKGNVYDPTVVAQRKNFRGTLVRVGSETMRILVDGVAVLVPVLHAKGTLKARELVHTFDFWWLDDPAARLLMHYRFEDYTEHRVVRIDYPGVRGAEAALTTNLAKTCRAELSGVYFASGSAQLLSASRPALESIADILKKHPDWKITIEGHTDNVGNDVANLTLSRNRAAAVKDYMTSREAVDASRIKIEGVGRNRPIDNNETIEGRAHNRRVEVARAC